MRNQEWDTALAQLDTLDLAKLVLGLLSRDTVDGEATLDVVDETEVLASLVDGDDIHEASGESRVGADLAVDLDETLHKDGVDLTTVQGILETVTDEDNQRHAVSELVRTGRSTGSIGTGQFVQEPVRGGGQALLMLLTARIVSRMFVQLQFDVGSRRVFKAAQRCAVATIKRPLLIRKDRTHTPRAILDSCRLDAY